MLDSFVLQIEGGGIESLNHLLEESLLPGRGGNTVQEID
jgi:hypothetical protein